MRQPSHPPHRRVQMLSAPRVCKDKSALHTTRLAPLLLLLSLQATASRLRALILLNARALLGCRRDETRSIPYPIFDVVVAVPGIGKVTPHVTYISQLILVLVFAFMPIFLHMRLPSFPTEAKKVSTYWLTGWYVRRPAPG